MPLAVLWLAMLPAAAAAQTVTTTFRGSVVSVEPATRAAIGGTAAVDLTSHLAVGLDADYFGISDWARTVSVAGTLAVALARDGWASPMVPYLIGGAGYHRQEFELGSTTILGPIDAVPPGTRFCPAPGRGPMAPGDTRFGPGECASGDLPRWGVNDLPAFYARRLGVLMVPDDQVWPERVFEDLAYTVGGGVRFRAGRVVLGPEVRLWIATHDGHTRPSALFGGTVGYRF
jgi:hypothetical protein